MLQKGGMSKTNLCWESKINMKTGQVVHSRNNN